MRTTTILGLGLALACAGCGGEEEVAGPRTVAVARGAVEVAVSAAGPIQPLRAVEVKSRASGEVESLPYDAGMAVSEGTTLAVIDPREERERFRLSEADLLSAKARLTQARARYDLLREQVAAELERAEARVEQTRAELVRAGAEHRRQRDLHGRGLASDQALETATSQLRTAEAGEHQAEAEHRLAGFRERELAISAQEVILAEAGVLRAEVAYEEAEKRLRDTVIRAPMAGTLLERKVEPGMIIASGISNIGGGTTLMTLADVSRLFVKAQVDEADVGGLREGMPARVVVDAFPEARLGGAVSWISPLGVQEQEVTSFEVLVEVTDRAGVALRCGMTATARFVTDRHEGVLWVPPTALRTRGERSWLDLPAASGEQAGALEVTPGLRGPDRIEVRGEGLREGLEVLLTRPEREAPEGERGQDPLWFLKKKKS